MLYLKRLGVGPEVIWGFLGILKQPDHGPGDTLMTYEYEWTVSSAILRHKAVAGLIWG